MDVCLHARMRDGMKALSFPHVAYPYLRSKLLPGANAPMRDGLKQACQGADILHANGLWNMPSVYPGWAVKGTNCIATPPGRRISKTWHAEWRRLFSGRAGSRNDGNQLADGMGHTGDPFKSSSFRMTSDARDSKSPGCS